MAGTRSAEVEHTEPAATPPTGEGGEVVTDLSHVRGVLFDLDGVVYVGATPLPGAQAVFDWLEQTGRPYILVTNNSTRTPRQYQDKLLAMDIRVPLRAIYTS